jgi:acetyl esterase/lipase
MLQGRWTWRPSLNEEMYLFKDVHYYTVPGTERQLRCDLWQPPLGVAHSGLAFIYLHGSGWHFLDKDVGTRPLFRHLTAQGHVVMDVAYRLCPETNWRGMLDDVKHAIAWMKRNAAHYGVDPNRIVVGGGSAGAHLALLAAYTAGQRDLTPDDLLGTDLSVRGVVSWYGPTDMTLYYYHAGKILNTRVQKRNPMTSLTTWLTKVVGFNMEPPAYWQPGMTVQDSMMSTLLGGTPSDVPEMYRRTSPIVYANRNCPPTLLLQGEHDSLVSAEGARTLAERLRYAGAQVIYVEYPQTEHAFDLLPPGASPAAQASWYETERFLALLAEKPEATPVKPSGNGAVLHPKPEPKEKESELVPA